MTPGASAAAGAPGAGARVTPPRAEVRIDLAAYRRNVSTLRGRLAGGSQLWAVVKANAYGHDVDHLAQEAVAAGARRLCVATLSEARHLRQAGIRVPLLVMGPLDAPSLRRAVDLDASVTVLSGSMVAAVEGIAGRGRGRRSARVHLKVDTGMGRWGIPVGAVDEAVARLRAAEGVELEGIMTHFATADRRNDDGFFDLQLQRFEEVVARVREHVPGVLAHAANSAAVLRSERAHFDAVRCGIATFGLDPHQRDPARHGLEPVLALRSHVADVKLLQPGESTGYERSFVATEPTLVAEVPIGYADGVRRSLANVGEALVRGVPRRIIGNVSMDHLSLHVDGTVEVGDVVTLIGADGAARIGAEDHARWAGTINYEVTCGIAGEPRLLRAHIQSGS